MILAERSLMLDMKIAEAPDSEPHFLDDLHEALGMYEEIVDDDDDTPLASVTDIAAFVENVNAKLGGGGDAI